MTAIQTDSRLATLVELSIDLAGERAPGGVLRKLTGAACTLLDAGGALACVCGMGGPRHAVAGTMPDEVVQRLCAVEFSALGPYLFIPMTLSSEFLGSLVVASRPGAAPFSENDAALARTLTMHGSLIYEKAVLYENLDKRVEERTRELHEVNLELESFSDSVSHDLRAPLRAINGFTDILLARETDDDKARGYLGRVRAAAARMEELIDDLLTLSRCVRADVTKTRVDVSAIAKEIVGELRAASPARAADVVIEEGLFAYADAGLLRVILTNLLGNAWKFSAKRERARIELARCDNGGGDAFVVRDNGAGFDMTSAAKLFAPFQRFHPSSEFEGTGVGLATVQRLVHRQGGRVWAQSAPERGAAFFVTLPKGSG
ncbi:MAG TPA: ATP-binding protein [Thermoanaerobaculia bacterium]|nr:ATP-binding protein [Thermoanaerobaculia bacterium]